MNAGNSLSSKTLLIIACIIFDIAVITGYFLHFSLFNLLYIDMSVLILLVLLISLGLINAAIIGQGALYNKIGVAYANAFLALSIIYAVIANSLSFILFARKIIYPQNGTVRYVIWQLVVLATFIGICSIMNHFANRSAFQLDYVQTEQSAKNAINFQLLTIEALAGDPDINVSFKKLKERILASTPFGRIRDNQIVYQMEGQISNNLAAIKANLEQGLGDENKLNILKLIDNTHTLVVNREKLIIK